MTTMTNTAANDQTAVSVSAGALFGAGLLGGVASAVANLALLFGSGAAGVSLEGVFQPGQPVASLSAVPVLLSSIVPAIPGALLALLLVKFARQKAALVFAVISAIFTVLSLGGPANVQGLSTGGLVVMELMHVVAAVGIGGAIWRKLAGK